MVDFKGLETFVWVVSLGSFNGAARKLNTTQPAISQRIAQLEADFGVQLLLRQSRAVTPTAAGRQLLGYAERLLGLRTDMLATLRDSAALQGVVRIGVAETIVHTWLPRFIKTVKQTYPGLSIETEVDISPSLQARLMAQELDLAFMLGPLTAVEVRNRVLCHHRTVFVASPDLAIPRPATLRDIAAHPIFTFPRKSQPYEIVKSLFVRPDLPNVSLNTSASLGTVRLLALEGLGVAVIPLEIVRADVESGALVLLDTELSIPDLTFTASWLAAPDALQVELVAEIAVRIARESETRNPSVGPARDERGGSAAVLPAAISAAG